MTQARIHRQPIQPYGDAAAAWIEHAVRAELVEDLRADPATGPWDLLVRSDGESHPPVLHLTHAALGAAVGHSAEAQVPWAPLWLLILAASMALVGRAIGGGAAAAAAFVGTLLTPALHGAATRIHYDLPMTALLWGAVAVLVTAIRGRSWWAAPVAAGLLFLAALTKWTAVPFGAVMLLGVALSPVGTRRARLSMVAAAAAAAGALIALYLSGSTQSFVGGQLALGAAGPAGLPWYLARIALAGLSPLGALAVAALAVPWWRADRPGVGLIGAVIVGQLAFLLIAVEVRDERFVITLLPALVLLAALGWAHRPDRSWSAAILAALALVAIDMHGGPGRTVEDSVERRGWATAASTPDDAPALRRATWDLVARCGATRLGIPGGITETGDVWWLRYRAALARLDGGGGPLLILNPIDLGRTLWWPDPDSGRDVWEHDALGFSWDRLPDPPPRGHAALRAAGIPLSVFDAFPPDAVLARVPLGEDTPIPRGFRRAAATAEQHDGVQVALFNATGRCGP